MIKVRVTDEFHQQFDRDCEDVSEAMQLVNKWLSNLDATPIYEIVIEIS